MYTLIGYMVEMLSIDDIIIYRNNGNVTLGAKMHVNFECTSMELGKHDVNLVYKK